MWVVCGIRDKPPYVAQILLQMSMSEKCNTLHRLLHFNFCGICDQSVMSLTPSGDPQPISCRPPKPRRRGGWGVRWWCWWGGGDTFDWWWCELNRKRLRESFYQARNTSGLKCSCTTLCIMQQPGRISRGARSQDESCLLLLPPPQPTTRNFAEAGKQGRNTWHRAENRAEMMSRFTKI